jgi:uncharacterized membrane protein YhaH (DUF805 family)
MSSSYPGYGPVPLDKPLYGAGPIQAVSRFFRKYATFSGRASRSEFWWVYLLNLTVGLILCLPYLRYLWTDLQYSVATSPYASWEPTSPDALSLAGFSMRALTLWQMAVLIPSLALFWRRMHDAGKSGLVYLLLLIPGVNLIGTIVVFVFLLMGPNPEGVRYDRHVPGRTAAYPEASPYSAGYGQSYGQGYGQSYGQGQGYGQGYDPGFGQSAPAHDALPPGPPDPFYRG